jgi:hypothetical protein
MYDVRDGWIYKGDARKTNTKRVGSWIGVGEGT